MANGNPYARAIKMMQRQGSVENGYDMALATVIGIDPISVAINGLPVSEHIYCNRITNSNRDEELAAILESEEYVSPALLAFIKDLYEGTRVQPGDSVLVQRVGNSFYICGKVASA